MKKIILAAAAILAVAASYWLAEQYLRQNDPASSAAPAKITVVDMAGRKVTLDSKIDRIVLTRGRDIYELAALLDEELPDRMVGWCSEVKTKDTDAYNKFTARFPALKRIAEVGDIQKDALSVEQLIALKPDLVIMDVYAIERGYKVVDKLEESGLPVVYIDGSSDPLTSPQKSVALLGKILGKDSRAKAINSYINGKVEKIKAALNRDTSEKPSLYLETGDAGPSVYGNSYGGYGDPRKYSAFGAILAQAGVRNIADGIVQNMAPINPEYLLSSNPDIVIITGAYWPSQKDSMRLGYNASEAESRRLLAGFTGRPGWDTLSAVKNHKVYSLFHGFTMHIFDFVALEQIAKWSRPDLLKDVDPAADLKEFHARFLPVDYSGVWALSLK